MDRLPRYYLRLFNSVTDAIALMEEMNFGAAKKILIEGQCWSENLYVEERQGELSDEQKVKAWLTSAREAAEAERRLAEREEDEAIDARIRKWRMAEELPR